MTRNAQNNIRNELNVPTSVELEVSNLHTLKKKNHNGLRRPYLIGHDANRGGVASKHLGDFSCLETL